MTNEESLKNALAAINQAKKAVGDKRNEEDRKYIVSQIGKDLIQILTPLLENIAQNSRMTKTEMMDVISQIKVESPNVNIEPAQIKVEAKVPEVKFPPIPKIEFPKDELIKAMKEAIGKIKFPKPEKVPDFPKEIKVAKFGQLLENIEKIATARLKLDLGEVNRDNPLPVILTDEDGRFYKAIMTAIEGGGKGIGSLKQTEGRLQIDVMPGTYELAGNTIHLKKYYTSAIAVTDGVVWSPPAGRRWYITDIFINTEVDSTITLEDDLVAGDSVVWKAILSATSGWSHSFTTPLYSGEDGADLLITTSGAGGVFVTITGYEI